MLLMTLVFSNISAQKYEDVVYLSNGSIIRGVLLSDSTGNKTLILSNSGDTWAFENSEIDSVKREKKFDYTAAIFNTRGSEFKLDAEFLLRSGNNSVGRSVIPGVGIGYGYRVDKYFAFAAETGIQFYELTEIPVSAAIRARMSDRTVTPVMLLRTGYTIPGEKRGDDFDYSYKSRGGFHFTAGAGLERIISNNTALLFTISYHYQELNYHLTPLHQWVQERDRKETYSRVRITLGYIFK